MAVLAPLAQRGPATPHPEAITHLFSHSSASVAPTLGHSAPYMPFSTSRMFCRVLNLAGSVSYTALIFWNRAQVSSHHSLPHRLLPHTEPSVPFCGRCHPPAHGYWCHPGAWVPEMLQVPHAVILATLTPHSEPNQRMRTLRLRGNARPCPRPQV